MPLVPDVPAAPELPEVVEEDASAAAALLPLEPPLDEAFRSEADEEPLVPLVAAIKLAAGRKAGGMGRATLDGPAVAPLEMPVDGSDMSCRVWVL